MYAVFLASLFHGTILLCPQLHHPMTRQLLLALLFTSATCAHAQWSQVLSNTTQSLYAVHFPLSNAYTTGYAVGYAGTVIKTEDRGLSWSALTFPNAGDLQSVWFLDAVEGFAVGDSGIYRTENGGDTWMPVSTPVVAPWRDIRFISPLIGFCGGGAFGDGTILRTQDGGDTWLVVQNGVERPIACIQFPTAEIGYAVEYGYSWSVLKTTDGGSTWNPVPIQPITNLSSLEAVYFTDENTGYVGGWYLAAFIRTDDGGASWSDLGPDLPYNLYDIAFASATNGLAVGWNGAIHHTYNGMDWMDETWPENVVLYAADMLDDTTAVVVGDGGAVLRWAAGTTVVPIVPSPVAAITLHPSPATDWIMLDAAAPLPTNARFELRDALGRVVLNTPARANTRIDVSAVSAGTYVWRCAGPMGVLASGTVVVR